jgi:hypothetical protein
VRQPGDKFVAAKFGSMGFDILAELPTFESRTLSRKNLFAKFEKFTAKETKMALKTYGDKPISFQIEENGEFWCVGSEVSGVFAPDFIFMSAKFAHFF